jgi:hypothetical protein
LAVSAKTVHEVVVVVHVLTGEAPAFDVTV